MPRARALALTLTLFSAATLASGSQPHTPGRVCHSWAAQRCQPPPAVSVWPQPQSLSTTATAGVPLGVGELVLKCGRAHACDDVLRSAIARYTAIIFGTSTVRGVADDGGASGAAGLAELNTLTIEVAQDNGAVLNATLMATMDESYTLTVNTTGALLRAPTTVGALRGLETFAQLIDFAATPPTIANTPIAVVDQPRFSWRGLRVDTARHFLPLATLKRALDAMAASKLNVFMWHIVDGNSFPLSLPSFPELAAAGSYCPQCIYTADDVRELVEYARQRGIRVQPEIDVPGHSGWQYGRPDLVACPDFELFRGGGRALDPTQDAVYEFLKRFMVEAASLFPDPAFNFCGDEVQFACLDGNPKIKAWAAARNMSYEQVEQHFWQRMNEPDGVIAALTAMGKTIAVAEGSSAKQGSVNLTHFPPKVIAGIWGRQALSAGVYGVLHNNSNAMAIVGGPYYLDVEAPYQPGVAGDPLTRFHYGWMDTWQDFYNAEPLSDPRLSTEEQGRVLGGMAEQWSEQVDASSIESRMWPRALAVAERMWSPRSVKLDENVTSARLQKASCQALERRGIRGGPVEPSFCPWSLHW